VRVVVAAGTLWLLFGLGVMLNVTGERRLMRVADALLGVEFVALVTAWSLDVPSVSTVLGLVVAPSLAVGFLVFCLQQALRASRDAARR
jgi:hypothetical protein